MLVYQADRPVLHPDRVQVTQHAIERYMLRRSCHDRMAAHQGIVRLLERAAAKSTPPLELRSEGGCRRYTVAGYTLVLDPELRTLLTLYRAGKKARR